MADQNIAVHVRTLGVGTYQSTTQLDHSVTELTDTRWFSADITSNVKVSAWLHPDTSSPSLDDPTNIMITNETSFTLPKAVGLAEQRPQCLAIPTTHKNLTFQLRQTAGAASVDTYVAYQMR